MNIGFVLTHNVIDQTHLQEKFWLAPEHTDLDVEHTKITIILMPVKTPDIICRSVQYTDG